MPWISPVDGACSMGNKKHFFFHCFDNFLFYFLKFKICFIIIFLPNESSSLRRFLHVFEYTVILHFSRVLTSRFCEISGLGPRIKIRHSDHSMDRSINISRQFEQEFESCHLMFKGSKEKSKQLPLQRTCKEKTNFEIRVLKPCAWGETVCFRFLWTALEPNPCWKRKMEHASLAL